MSNRDRDEADRTQTEGTAESAGGDEADADETDSVEDLAESDPTVGVDEGERDRAVPLADLTRDIEERRRTRETPDVDEVFEPAGSEPVVDGEAVWEALVEDRDDSGLVAFAETVEDESAAVHVIPSSVCHGCPHFGDPPELHCVHEGTTIRRVVDMDHFEVVACPVVEQRSDLHGD
jgi:hypothetical protein